MKDRTHRLIIPTAATLALLAMLLITSPGCGTIFKRTDTPVYSTNVQTGVITLVTNSTYSVNPGVTKIVDGIGAATPLIPPPYGTLVSAALALASAGLGYVARVKSKQAAEHQDAATVATGILNTVIAGVEVAGDAKTKQTIANLSAAAGNSQPLDAAVQSVAANIPPAATSGGSAPGKT